MIPVFILSEKKEYDFENVLHKLECICEEHRTKNLATVFGFLFWDSTDPNFQNIIPTEAFRNAIDETIGDKISLFTIFTRDKLKYNRKNIPSERINLHMHPISTQKSVSLSSKEIAEKCFNYDGSMDLPALLLFQVANKEIIDQILIEIDSDDTDKAIKDLIKLLKSAVNAVERIDIVNKNNYNEIFNQVEGNLKYTNTWRLVNRKIKRIEKLADWVLRIAGLASIMNK